MGLFNRKKAAKKTEEVAAAVEKAADAAGEKIAPAVEKAADAVQGVVTAAGEKAADVIEQAAGAIKEKAAAVNQDAEEAVEKFAAVVDEAVNGEEAPAEEAPAEGAPSCGNPEGSNELTEKEKGKVYHVRMNYHAGYGVYNEWPNGGMTIHSGIGWFHPFGPSEYWGVANIPGNFCEEAKQFPLENYFTEDWMKNFETDLFCIYRLEEGDIYVWDGMFAVRGKDPNKCIVYNSEYTRQDVIVNVVVGGTGRFEGARGLLIGTTEGGGKTQVCGKMPDGSDLELPETIMKDLDGWIRLPDKD